MSENAASALRDLRDALRDGIPDADGFVFRLSSVLSELGLSPTSVVISSSDPKALKYLPAVQQSLLFVLPTFLPALDERGRSLLEAFFVPPPTSSGNSVALTSYITLSGALAQSPPTPLPLESRQFVLDTLVRLVWMYGVDALFWAVWGVDGRARQLVWDDAVRAATSLPAKVANAVGRWKEAGWSGDVPPPLVPRAYFDALVRRLEGLAYELALTGKDSAPLRVLIEKLAALGLLSPPPEPSPSPSLLPPLLPPLLRHLHPPPGGLDAYPDTFYPALLLPLPSSTLASLADALLAHLPYRLPTEPSMEPDVPDARVRRAATVLAQLLGTAEVGGDAWNAVVQALMGGKLRSSGSEEVHQARRRMVVAWAGTSGLAASRALVDTVLEAWADPKGIKFGLFTHQLNLTHTLLLAISLLPPLDSHLVTLSRRARFIQAIQSYLSHPDATIRRLGMLVAEVISDRTIEEEGGDEPSAEQQMEELKAGLDVEDDGALKPPKPPMGPKKLRFTGIWDGSGQGQEECGWLRRCVGVRDGDAPLDDVEKAWMLGWDVPEGESDAPPQPPTLPKEKSTKERGHSTSKVKPKPKIVMLDDDQLADPLQGYAESEPSSSRSPSPTPSFLEEVAADPTLALDATKKRKLKRPVYVRQLVELLRDKDKPESLERALQWGEGLIRAKRGFGTEVADNAVAVAAAALALANPFNLDDFDKRRQGIVTALVACSPRNVPPFLAEQYFTSSYSLLQKSVMLTALAMGARELAGLPVPDPPKSRDFATKTLPPALHNKYITLTDVPAQAPSYSGQLEDAVSGMRNLLLSKGAKKGEEVPEIARERRLRINPSMIKRQKVDGASALGGRGEAGHEHPDSPPPPVVPYAQVAAEFFILPLLNRFWDYFSDASTREVRSLASGGRYRGAGTGMVLSPLALGQFLATLALLVHAARHAPTFLSVLCPSALELAVTIGARHPAAPSNSFENTGGGDSGEGAPEVQVVGSALELALAALDTAVDLDAGRAMAVDHPEMVLAAGEWATKVFDVQSGRGSAIAGAGGSGARLRAAAAGVVVKVAEIGEKWGPGVG